jgi:hypothetical protein
LGNLIEESAMTARGNEFESWTPASLAGQSDNAVPKLSLAGLANDRSDLQLVRMAQAGSPVISDAAPPTLPADRVEAKMQHQVQAPRLDGFNADLPFDRFRVVADGLTASSRIRREQDPNQTLDNYRSLIELLHPKAIYGNPLATEAQIDKWVKLDAQRSAIIDLRTRGDKTLDASSVIENDKDMDSEERAAQALGFTYHNRPMISKFAETPQDLKDTADLIEKEFKSGKEVDVHCYHGTDRTGLVVEAYKAAYHPRIADMVKNQGQQGVDDAYAELGKDLLKNGVDPATHQAVFQSLRQYLQFLHDGQNGNTVIPVADIPIANDTPQQNALRSADARLSAPGGATLENYREMLIQNFDQFDPATHNAFYRQLDKDFSRNYIQQHSH